MVKKRSYGDREGFTFLYNPRKDILWAGFTSRASEYPLLE